MKILVTGRDGQLGSELQGLAPSSHHQFVFVGSKDGDITDAEKITSLIAQHEIEAIINCAAYTAVDKAESDPELAAKVNTDGVQNLVSICAEKSLKLLHISTDYVFPGNGSAPYKTTDPVHPLGVYGSSKLGGEKAILNASIDGLIIRTSWVYSTFGNNFVKTMLRLGNERDSITVVNDQKGCPTYARDLAQVCLQLIEKRWNPNKRVYHFSNSGAITWFEFAKEIMTQAKINCTVTPVTSAEFPTPAKRPSYSVMDLSDIENDFGISPRNWKLALSDCLSEI